MTKDELLDVKGFLEREMPALPKHPGEEKSLFRTRMEVLLALTNAALEEQSGVTLS